ncbi:hypothetical protein AYI70_g3564 [Smittium culicis]|uniref:Uncharacterized protein n=1 Tax=Smittium culicis TaxID=133412 RepID=A0A1R1Y2U9_9FUNG|nr:hypothetical protein AYI70_g3564 [Smittium culicis]
MSKLLYKTSKVRLIPTSPELGTYRLLSRLISNTSHIHCFSTKNSYPNSNKSIGSVSRLKIKYNLPTNHLGLLDTSKKLPPSPSYIDRVNDRNARREKTQHNRFVRFSTEDPSILDLSSKVLTNPFGNSNKRHL